MTDSSKGLLSMAEAAKAASRILSRLPTETKNKVLSRIAAGLLDRQTEILQANKRDYERGVRSGLSTAVLDRLLLTQQRLTDLATDIQAVIELPDPVGETYDASTLLNGLEVTKRLVPLGVIGTIYESRPNVTIEISVLSLKSGNAAILRGGKESLQSNIALVDVIGDALEQEGAPVEAIQLIQSSDRTLVDEMLRLRGYIDLLIPRGGEELIRFVSENAHMPVITGGIGVSHTYIDRSADPEKAVAIAYNAKVQRPTVCNALDTLLIHVECVPSILPNLARLWATAGVRLRCDQRALTVLGPIPEIDVQAAVEQDWGREFLSLNAAVKVVDSIDEALAHIERYGSQHSEAIVTEDRIAADRFLDEVDAAVVFANASTRFTDGGQMGLGVEVAISTGKLHARGPMGLRELTSYKWVVEGTGQVRSG